MWVGQCLQLSKVWRSVWMESCMVGRFHLRTVKVHDRSHLPENWENKAHFLDYQITWNLSWKWSWKFKSWLTHKSTYPSYHLIHMSLNFFSLLKRHADTKCRKHRIFSPKIFPKHRKSLKIGNKILTIETFVVREIAMKNITRFIVNTNVVNRIEKLLQKYQ